jgi:hypothetical protein
MMTNNQRDQLPFLHDFFVVEYTSPQPLMSLEIAPYTTQSIFHITKTVLEAHQVVIKKGKDHYLLLFPEGTVRCTKLPILQLDKFKVVLPDGLELYAAAQAKGYTRLTIQLEDVPEELRHLIPPVDALKKKRLY